MEHREWLKAQEKCALDSGASGLSLSGDIVLFS